MDDTKLLSQIEAAAIACRDATGKDFLETRRLVDEFRALATPENVLWLVGMVNDGLGLRWTKEPPTKTGWYLFKYKGRERIKAYNILSTKPFDNGENGHCFHYNNIGYNESVLCVLDGDGDWLGPLFQPQDAE